jgi:hypothetical protein
VQARSFSFNLSGPGIFKILLTDLLPGTWQVLKDGKIFIPAIPAASEDGALYFEGKEGIYKLLR